MTNYGMRPEDVRAWPSDPGTRAALGEYLGALGPDPNVVNEQFFGDFMDFSGADLSGLEFGSASLRSARMDGVPLAGASLDRATLSGVSLREADLSSALMHKVEAIQIDARDACFRDANLFRAELARSDLRGADLRGANMSAVSFFRADLRGADLSGCKFGPEGSATWFNEARLAGCLAADAAGHVRGPIDVGADEPVWIDGAEMQMWFRERGATVHAT